MSSGHGQYREWKPLFSFEDVAVSALTPLLPYVWTTGAADWPPSKFSSLNYVQLGYCVTNVGLEDVRVIIEASDDGVTTAIDSPEPVTVPAGKQYLWVSDEYRPYQYYRLSVEPVADPSTVNWSVKGRTF